MALSPADLVEVFKDERDAVLELRLGMELRTDLRTELRRARHREPLKVLVEAVRIKPRATAEVDRRSRARLAMRSSRST